jgi:spermidine synthase
MPWFYEHYKSVSAVGIHATQLVHEEKSEFQSIAVHDTVGHGRLLLLDGMVMLTELDEFVYHELVAHIPLCVHPDPKSVLVVGGGDGGAVREILRHPGVERVVQCEIDERVTRVCQQFIPAVAHQVEHPKVELVFADAVQYVAANPGTFDCILVDSTEPIGPAKALFSRSFFESLKRALKPGGIVAAQAESPFYAADVVKDTFATYREVFQHVHGYYGVIPTYPSGLWTFVWASDVHRPDAIDEPRAAALEPACRWYSRESARGAFLLPAFVRRLVDGGPLALALTGVLLALTGCPSQVAPPQDDLADPLGGEGPANDPRIIEESGALYAADSKAGELIKEMRAGDPAASPGTGVPDESNGKCRLYAPKFPNPECCPSEYGVDIQDVQRLCGYENYLGEHFRASCGYYFTSKAAPSPGEPGAWLRATFVTYLDTAQAAAEDHAEYIRRRQKDPGFVATPIPGIEGAYWSSKEGYHWAFLPGWSKVREVSWKDGFCEGHVDELLQMIHAAKEPPEGAEREGLLPRKWEG